MGNVIALKCSRCETVGESVNETRLACPFCGAEMLQLEEGQEYKTEHGKGIDGLPVANVVNLGFRPSTHPSRVKT